MGVSCERERCCLLAREGLRAGKTVVLLMLCVVIFGMTYAFLKSYREWKVVCYANTRLERVVDEAHEDFLIKRDYWNVLSKDPNGFKDMVRRRFGFVEPTEIVFKFKRPGRG
jgi:hypothetical protein